jgi:hypothetical protein
VQQSIGVHVVDEGALAVDFDHRKPLTVATLQLRHARDVDLLELESRLLADALDLGPRPLAERAVTADVEGDLPQG